MLVIPRSRLVSGLALALILTLQTTLRSAPPTTAPTTAGAGASDEGWTADNFRARADALWTVKHDYAKAQEAYRKGIDRFPNNVRLLVSLASTSIDFGYRNADSDAGRAAYKAARDAVDKGLKLIAAGNGQDVDEGAKAKLEGMSRQIP